MKHTSLKLGWRMRLAMVGAGAMLGGCGYTDLEMAAKQRQIDSLVTEVNALKASQGAACKTHGTSQARGAALACVDARFSSR